MFSSLKLGRYSKLKASSHSVLSYAAHTRHFSRFAFLSVLHLFPFRFRNISAASGTLGTDSVLACSGSLSHIIFPEMWGDCCSRHMAAAAASGRSTHGYNLLPVIIKAGDDLTQEAFALQVRCT